MKTSADERMHKESSDIDFLLYIVDCINSFKANSEKFNTSSMIRNLSAAAVLQHNLMQSDQMFREEIVRSIRYSSSTFSALHKLTSLLCIVHFEGSDLFTSTRLV